MAATQTSRSRPARRCSDLSSEAQSPPRPFRTRTVTDPPIQMSAGHHSGQIPPPGRSNSPAWPTDPTSISSRDDHQYNRPIPGYSAELNIVSHQTYVDLGQSPLNPTHSAFAGLSPEVFNGEARYPALPRPKVGEGIQRQMFDTPHLHHRTPDIHSRNGTEKLSSDFYAALSLKRAVVKTMSTPPPVNQSRKPPTRLSEVPSSLCDIPHVELDIDSARLHLTSHKKPLIHPVFQTSPIQTKLPPSQAKPRVRLPQLNLSDRKMITTLQQDRIRIHLENPQPPSVLSQYSPHPPHSEDAPENYDIGMAVRDPTEENPFLSQSASFLTHQSGEARAVSIPRSPHRSQYIVFPPQFLASSPHRSTYAQEQYLEMMQDVGEGEYYDEGIVYSRKEEELGDDDDLRDFWKNRPAIL